MKTFSDAASLSLPEHRPSIKLEGLWPENEKATAVETSAHLQSYGVATSFKPHTTLRKLLVSPKDPTANKKSRRSL